MAGCPGVQPESTVHTVTDVVRVAKQMAHDGAPVELEVRFGRAGGSFVPGMSPEQMDRIERQLRTCRDWTRASDDWELSMLFYHGSTIPGDTRVLRTESTYHSATSKEVRCVDKHPVRTHTYTVQLLDPIDPPPPIDFRVAAAVENQVPDVDIPSSTRPSRVVVRLRTEYLYTPLGRTRPAWSFMLTKRWSAATFHQALLLKETEPPQCDIELECVDPAYLLDHSAEQVGFKMLWKVYDLIGLLSGVELHKDEFSFQLARR